MTFARRLLLAILVLSLLVVAPAQEMKDNLLAEAARDGNAIQKLRVQPPEAGDLPPAGFKVKRTPGVAYLSAARVSDRGRQALDIYRPATGNDHPVLVFVHGGAWRAGSRDNPHYRQLCEVFAERGIVAVSVGYRLSPKVKHPAHVEDAAAAVAWVHQNVARFGGNPKRIFLAGHSAGGHLVALIAGDPKYLAPHKMKPADLAGVMPLAGVYVLYQGDGTPTGLKVVQEAFGNEPEQLRDASPINHTVAGMPPFRIVVGQNDHVIMSFQAGLFCKRLAESGVDARWMVAPGRDHVGLIVGVGDNKDPTTQLMLDFIAARGKQLDEAEKPPTSQPDAEPAAEPAASAN